MKRKAFVVLALALLVSIPLFAAPAEEHPFAFSAGIVYRLFTSAGIALLLMLRTIWNIIKDFNENHKASSVWNAVMKYLLVMGIIFLTLSAFSFMFGGNPSFEAARNALENGT
jgi:hypothetical protein